MTDLFSSSIVDQIIEVERELRQRTSAYPRFIADGRLTQARADRQMAAMQAVLATLRQLSGGGLPQQKDEA